MVISNLSCYVPRRICSTKTLKKQKKKN